MSAYTDTIRTTRIVNNDRGNYWRYYGLQRDPFALTTQDTGFYLPPRWEQYFDLLHYLCDSNNVLLTVTGIKGCGKTTFLRQFVTEINESKQICQLTGIPTLNTAQLKAALIKNFSLPQPVGETLEEQLDNLVADFQNKSQPCLLVIDEAHRLPEETLCTLLHLIKQQSENQMRLHVLLMGDSRLKNVLNFLAEREGDRELVHNLTLEPFTLDETKSYLKHRLVAVGLPSAMPFSQAVITRVYSLSEGVASRINAVARQTLIDGMQQRQLLTMTDYVRGKQHKFLGASVLFFVLVIMTSLLTREEHFSLAKYRAPAFTRDGISVTPMIAREQTSMPLSNEGLDVHGGYTSITHMLDKFRGHTLQSSLSMKQSTPVMVTDHTPRVVSAATAAVPSINLPVVAQANFSPKPLPVISANLQSSSLPAVPPIAMHPATTTPLTSAVSKMAMMKFAALTPIIPAVSKSVPMTSSLAWDPHSYTVQLVAMPDEKAIKKFIAVHQLTGQVNLVHLTKQGKDWYVALYGQYPTSAAARAAVYNLPTNLQKQKPWVRSFASIQKSMSNSLVNATTPSSSVKHIAVAKKEMTNPLQATMVTDKIISDIKDPVTME